MTIEGCLIKNSEGDYLARGLVYDLFWSHHTSAEKTMIHNEFDFHLIRKKYESYRDGHDPDVPVPNIMIPATWSEEEGVIVTGEEVDFVW